MTDLSKTIEPKSDQLNADDLIAGPITITVTDVRALGGEQPIAIHFEGDGGKPYKPGKAMRRVLVQLWGADGRAHVGRSMTLFRDESVLFGGVQVGGIRISHMSDIGEKRTLAVTVAKARRKPMEVEPLQRRASQQAEFTLADAEQALRTAAHSGRDALETAWKRKSMAPHREALSGVLDELKDKTASAPPAGNQEGGYDGV